MLLKVGFLLSAIMGINMRTTMDIDANITGMNFKKDKINEMIDDILSIEIDDDVIFEVEKMCQ